MNTIDQFRHRVNTVMTDTGYHRHKAARIVRLMDNWQASIRRPGDPKEVHPGILIEQLTETLTTP